MTLAPYRLSYNGLTFGANTGIELLSVTGLREAPATRGGDVPRPRRHGAFAGLTLFGERIVNAQLQVLAGSLPAGTSFEQALAQVSAAFANISDPARLLPLAFNLSPAWSSPRQVTGRVTKGGLPVDTNYGHGKAVIPLELTCPDPLIYDTATQNPSAGLASPTAGLGPFPVGFPIGFGASSGGSLQVVNGGNEPLPPVWTFTGPITWPTLTFGAYSLGFEITLAVGDTLVVDCGARTVILNGTASRYNTILTGSQFFAIPPGGATVGFSSVDSTQVTGTVTASGLPVAAWGWC